MPFGLTEEQKRWAIQQHGFNPDEYDMDESGFIGAKQQSNQPAAFATDRQDSSISTEPKPEQWGAGQTALHTAIRKAPGAAIGGSAAALSLPWAAGAAGPSFGTSLLVPLILGYLGSKAGDVGSEALLNAMNPEQQKQMAEAQSTHPLAATAGAISTMPLGGFNPNPMNMIRAGGTLPKLLTGMRPTTPELQNLLNVGVGAGVGAGAGIAEPLLSGQDVHGGDVALSALLGGLFNKPNAIGRRMGFHNPVSEQVHPDINALINQPTETPAISTEPQATPTIADLMATLSAGGAPYERGRVARGRLTPGGIEAMARVQENPFKGLRKPDITTEEELARLIGEGGIEPNPTEGFDIQRQTDFLKAKAELAKQHAELLSSLPKETQGPSANIEQTQELLKNVYGKPISARQLKMSLGTEGTAEAIMKRSLKGQYSEESALPEKKRPTTDFEKETAAKLEAAGIPTKSTSIWNKLLSDWGFTERNTVVMPDETIVNETTGKPIAGDSFIRQGIKTALARFNPGKAALDTIPHELFHVFFNDLRNSPKAYDKMLVRKAESYVSKSPEFAKINEQRTAQQLETWTPEEFLATEHGLQYINDRLNLAGEKSFNTWWNDLTSHIKTRYTTDATQADFRRLLNYRFINDPSFHEYFKTGINVKGGVNIANAKETQSKKEEGSILNTGAQESANKTSPDTIAKEFGLNYKPWNMAGIGEHWQFTTPTGETFYTKAGASRDEIKTLFDVKMKQFGKKSLQQDESSLTPINHPDIIDLLDNTIETAKAEKLTTDAGREVKTVLSTQVNLPEKLRTALEDVNASSLTDWIRFKVQLTKAIESGDLVNVPKQPLSKLAPELVTKPVPTEIAPAAKELKPQQIVQKPSPPPSSIDEARANAATIREKLLADAKKLETVTPSAEELHQHSDDIARYIKMSDEYLNQRKADKRFSDESSLNPDSIVRKAKGEGNTGYPFSKKEFDAGDKVLNDIHDTELAKGNIFDIDIPERNKLNQEESSLPKSAQEARNKQSFAPVFTARIDKIAEILKSPTANYVTDQLHKFSAESDRLSGKIGNKLIAATRDYTPEQITRVYRYLHQIDDKGESFINLNPKEKQLSNNLIEILREPRREQIASGPLVKEGGKFRLAGVKPEGYMFNMLDPKVAYTWAEKPLSPEAKSYDTAYIAHLKKHGIDETQARKTLNEYKVALGNQVSKDVEFGAIRKAEGNGLPWELVDQNFASAATRYGRRASRDLAFFKYIQKDSKMLKALNLRDQFGQYVAPETLPDVENISTSAEVQNAMRSVYGVDMPRNPRVMAASRLASNVVMGIGTAARNIANMPAFIANYIQVPQMPLVAKALSTMNESRVRAFENNAVKANFQDFDAAGFYEGNPNPAINLMNKFSSFLRKYQGRDMSDKFEGEFYYSLGELMAVDNVARAKEGNKESLHWVNKFSDTVDGGADKLLKGDVNNEDVQKMAKRFVDSARGTYSEAGLPSWAIEGELAPFAALSRFSIEKSNTIWKDVVLPAKKGIYGPLIRYSLASLGVGMLIDELNDQLTNKRGQEPKINEILASGNEAELVPKAISLLQLASFAGTVGDAAKLAVQAYKGKSLKYGQPLSFPLYTLVTDTIAGNVSDAAQAIKHGEDPFEVMGALATALSTQSVQTMRYLDANAFHPEEAKRKEKFRDYNVYQQLAGNDTPQGSDRPNVIGEPSIKAFKRTGDIKEAAAMLPGLIKNVIEEAKGDPEKLKDGLMKLKLNSYQTFPNPSTLPKQFHDYYIWLAKTQGSEEASARLADYLKQNAINKAKSAAVP